MPRIRRFAVSCVFAALLAAALFAYAVHDRVDLEDESWPIEMAVRDVALYGMEFPLDAAFSYGGDGQAYTVITMQRIPEKDIGR